MGEKNLNAETAESTEKMVSLFSSAASALSALKFSFPLLAVILLLAGCAQCPDEMRGIDQIVAEHNANAAKIPQLWARVEMDATLKPPGAPEVTWRSGSPTCLLLYRCGLNPDGPHDFALIGRETAAVELFRMGSSADQGLYYFWYRFGDQAGAWYGRLALAGAPGVAHLPFDPMQLLGVLGITPLPASPGRLPAAVLSMTDKPGKCMRRQCEYVVAIVDTQPVSGRPLLKREIILPWSRNEPPLPKQVNILDASGRRIMTATLSDYRPIDVSPLDSPPAEPPVMPTAIDIVWQDVPGQSRLIRRIRLRLSDMVVGRPIARGAEIEIEDMGKGSWLPEAVDFRPPAGLIPELVDGGIEVPAAKRGDQ